MSTLTEIIENLEKSLASAKEELAQFESGKKASANRLRKEAQVSKKLWQNLRVETITQLKSMPTKKRTKE